MRSKEDAHDYRYLPEPDLMPLQNSEEWVQSIRARVVELPLARKLRFIRDYQLPAADAETFKADVPLGNYFEGLARKAAHPKAVANWIINNLRALMSEQGVALEGLRFQPDAILELVGLVESGMISSRTAQEVFIEMFASGTAPSVVVEKRGLVQVSDTSALEKFCDEVIASNPRSVEDYRSGKAAALNFLKGQVMKVSKGKANPALVGEILEKKLRV